jgi:predicted RNase H-like HicB family nuclease
VSTELEWTAVYVPVEDGWIEARVAELPGVITTAPTLAEAKELLLDALREFLLSLRQESNEPPSPAGGHREHLHVVIDAA